MVLVRWAQDTGEVVVFPIAVWALTKSNTVVGLICDAQTKSDNGQTTLAVGFEAGAYVPEGLLEDGKRRLSETR